MTTITGTKAIINVAHIDRALDVDAKGVVVGNPKDIHAGSTQKWTILKRPADTYVIHNTFHNKYLGYEGPNVQHLKPVLTTNEYLWEIVLIHGHYKLEVNKVGTVCSLDSSQANSPVTIVDLKGENEEWILQDVPVDPVITGEKIIKNLAFKNRVLQSGSPSTAVHANAPVQGNANQKWTISKSGPDNTYLILNTVGGYLSVDPTDKEQAFSSKDQQQLWDIVPINAQGFYKIEVHNVGTVCSLRTSEEGAKVRIANFLGQNEEWTLEDA